MLWIFSDKVLLVFSIQSLHTLPSSLPSVNINSHLSSLEFHSIKKGILFTYHNIVKIVSSYDIVFDEIFSSALAYTSQPYAEAISMQYIVSYIAYDTYSNEKLVI